MQIGDLVMICEHSTIKSKYKLAVVDTVHPSDDGFVRSVSLRYVNVQMNNGGVAKASTVLVKRSVQRLVMILPVEEQVVPLEVQDHEHFVVCKSMVKAGV